MKLEQTNNRKTLTIANMTKIALCVAALCVSSYLVIPLPFTPIVLSAHTIVVNLIGLILPPLSAACTLITYLIMGLIGLPVFSGGTSGPGKLFGPTGGFYFGFLVAVIVISLLKGKKTSSADSLWSRSAPAFPSSICLGFCSCASTTASIFLPLF